MDVGEGGGVESGTIPCSFSNAARFREGTFVGFSAAGGAVVVGACGWWCIVADVMGAETDTGRCCGGAGCSTVVVVMTGWWVTMLAVGAEDTILPPVEMRGADRVP